MSIRQLAKCKFPTVAAQIKKVFIVTLSSMAIVHIQPEGYVHAAAFDEIALGLQSGFSELGYSSEIFKNTIANNTRNIILGAHLIGKGALDLPDDTIIFNLEQLKNEAWFMSENYVEALSKYEVWDYSERNIDYLKSLGPNVRTAHVPIGFANALHRIPEQTEQDIDVLFYGLVNERRRDILLSLREEGLNVVVLSGVYGQKRDEVIGRSKVVLNMHFYETKIFEIARVSYLLANKKAVVSEVAEGTQVDAEILNCIKHSSYDGLVDACKELVADTEQRKNLERVGFSTFKEMKQSNYLLNALNQGH